MNFATNEIESARFNCFGTLRIEQNNALNNQYAFLYNKSTKRYKNVIKN